MGLVYANIELSNSVDVGMCKRGIIGTEEVRQMTVHAMVDTGSVMLAINEEIKWALGLDEVEPKRLSRLADGQVVEFEVVGPIQVAYEGRICNTNALVLPGDAEVLLGAIPMEELDLWVNPNRNVLTPIHPEGQLMTLK